MLLAEDLGHECFHRGALLPGIHRQPCFAAGLLEEGDTIPLAFDRHLWQQKAATEAVADEQAVSSHFNQFRGYGTRLRENAQFDLEMPRLFQSYGMKPGVFKCSGASRFSDCAVDRADGQDIAHASSKVATEVQGSESTPRIREVRSWRIEGNLTIFERREYGLVCEAKKSSPLFLRELTGKLAR